MSLQHTSNSMSSALSELLASTYLLYLKTQNYHWNVKGENFFSLHNLFETHYQELSIAIDLIAERIRMADKIAPGTFEEFKKLSVVKESALPSTAKEMVKQLRDDHSSIMELIRNTLGKSSDNDFGNEGVFADRLQAHEKMHWMLDSHIS
jgi:starvation-inducible DNA-binding protein